MVGQPRQLPLMDQAPGQTGQILAPIAIVDKTIANGKLAEKRDKLLLMVKVEAAYVRFMSMRLREGSEENPRAESGANFLRPIAFVVPRMGLSAEGGWAYGPEPILFFVPRAGFEPARPLQDTGF